MANNSALKLVVDTSEYDANIKKAAEGIQHLAKRVHDAGGFFDYFDKATMDFVKGLEDMSTSAVTSAGQYRELENAYKGLAATYNSLDPFEKQGEAGKALGQQLEILKDRVLEAKANFDAASKSLEMPNVESTKSQLRDLTKEITDLTVAYRALSDEERQSPVGQEMAQKIQTMTEKAGVMRDAMADVQASIQHAASDTRVFDQLAGGAQAVTAGFQAATGAAKLLGINIGDNVEVIAKLQAAMSVVNGLQTIQNALQGQSAVMQGVQTVKTLAQTAANAALASSIAGATIAQKAFNAVANANPYVLLASAIIGVVGALATFCSGSDEAAEKEEELKKAAEEAKRALEQQQSAMASAASKAAESAGIIMQLMQSYHAANTEIQKKEILEQAATTFESMGMKVKDADGAQRLLVENGPKLVQMFQKQAEAAALEAIYIETLRDEIKKLIAQGESVGSAVAMANSTTNIEELRKEMMATRAEANSLAASLKKVITPAETKKSGSSKSSKSSKTADPVAGSIAEQEQRLSELQKAWKNAADDDSRARIKKQIDLVSEALDHLTGKDIKPIEVQIEAQFPDLSTQNFNTGNFDVGRQLMDKVLQDMASAAQEADYATITDFVKLGIEQGVDSADMTAIGQKLVQATMDPDDIDPADMEDFLATMKEELQGVIDEQEWPQIELAIKTGDLKEIEKYNKQIQQASKRTEDGWKQAASAVGQLGSTLAQIEDPGIKAAGTVIKAISDIALGFAQASVQASSLGPWGWTAFLAAGAAAMATTINTVHTLTGFANGGIVPGNSFSGDQLHTSDYGINSGELILTRAQQGNLASQLEGGVGLKNIQLRATISGEDIILVTANNDDRWGRGEYARSTED